MPDPPTALSRTLARFSETVTRMTGSSWGFVVALLLVAVWAATGPLFDFSDTWQLVINTGTTIVTFLMVFLIQRAQNKDALAIQLKLNELVAALEGASNQLIDVEDLGEEELQALRAHYRTLVSMARREVSVTRSHSVAEAEARHARKIGRAVRTNAEAFLGTTVARNGEERSKT